MRSLLEQAKQWLGEAYQLQYDVQKRLPHLVYSMVIQRPLVYSCGHRLRLVLNTTKHSFTCLMLTDKQRQGLRNGCVEAEGRLRSSRENTYGGRSEKNVPDACKRDRRLDP